MFLKNRVDCVARVSNRVIARKLEREKKNKTKPKQKKQKKSILPVKYLIILSTAAF